MGKGQVSIEYMLVLGFMFLMLIPLVALYNSAQQDSSDELVNGQLLRVGNTLRDAAERVYFAGDPAQEQVELYFPDKLKQISIYNTSIVFTAYGGSGPYDLLIPGLAPMNGSLKINKGVHIVTLVAQNGIVQIRES